jgi:ribonuclease HII
MKRPRLTAFDRTCFGENAALVGVDEAGRGALAGPVVAAACWVRRDFYETPGCRRVRPLVRDSKELSADEREAALRGLEKCREAGGILFFPGVATVEEIAEHNILGATRVAMRRAVDAVLAAAGCPPGAWLPVDVGDLFFDPAQDVAVRTRPLILVDGRPLKPFFYPHRALVKGDGRSFAIAAASIVAKVTRDRLMQELHEAYPLYGFDSCKGYGTPKHVDALSRHGTCPLHRERFLRKLLETGMGEEGEDLFEVDERDGSVSATGPVF